MDAYRGQAENIEPGLDGLIKKAHLEAVAKGIQLAYRIPNAMVEQWLHDRSVLQEQVERLKPVEGDKK